jgi:hypothetical protein
MSCINLVNNTTENNITLVSDRINIKANTKVNLEVSCARGPAGLNGSIASYSTTLDDVTEVTINDHGLSNINGIFMYTPEGDEVSVAYNLTGLTVSVISNISLLNHILKIV